MEWNLLLANFLTVVAGVVLANFLRSLFRREGGSAGQSLQKMETADKLNTADLGETFQEVARM